jgi:lauroyl/myristoyl acyltransferase
VGAEVEQVVELQPAQYQWEYKRFKHATPGIDVYKHFS